MFKWLFGKKHNHPRHTTLTHENDQSKVLCIYVSYNIDDDDIQFIEANKSSCVMVIIESVNAPSLSSMQAKNIEGITYMTRQNIGYDATSWKEYVLDNIDDIRTYD